MRKRKQILKTNILAQMLYERQEKSIKILYRDKDAYTYAYAYASASASAYASAYTSASAYTYASASAYTSASAYAYTSAQVAKSGPNQIMLIVEGIKVT